MKETARLRQIQRKLVDWYEKNARDLPWRNTKNPYEIWLSEIILQQTRVDQGMPYFLKFIQNYPDVGKLAAASEDEIKKMWEGLGYYRRADNMHKTARLIVEKYQAGFPSDYKELLKLPGIGPYTAAAIVSFAFDKPFAVLDGNVFRVLSRLFDVHEPVNSTSGKRIFQALADQLLDRKNPGIHNQAIMEFGAIHCTPNFPLCNECPLQYECLAFQRNTVADLPRKIAPKKRKERYLHYLISLNNGQIAIRKRTGNDIWKGLYEFPGLETQRKNTRQEIVNLFKGKWNVEKLPIHFIKQENHELTHQKLHLFFWHTSEKLSAFEYRELTSVIKLAFPRPLQKVLDDLINMSNFEN